MMRFICWFIGGCSLGLLFLGIMVYVQLWGQLGGTVH